ncbi:MAG: hypothetical protein NTU89_01930 [Candidatus Dependentiae bacterium]|nr:hypothetical protein [Candidatus Dependentiae bacterium]
MKKSYLSIIAIFLTIFQQTQAFLQDSTKLFSGSIEFPIQMDYDLCIFYKGEKLKTEQSINNDSIQFSFVDKNETQTIFLIITHSMTCITEESNTIEHLKLTKDNSYICYKLQAQREMQDDDHQILTWKIEEHALTQRVIPQNSLIFLFDPSLIAGLKIQSWKPECVFRIVPTIIAVPTATQKELDRAITIARLAALDIDAIHAKTTKNIPTQAVLVTALQ